MIIRNCDIRTFYSNLNERKIICFCAGLQLHSFINMYDFDLKVSESIKYIVDNDKFLHTDNYKINGKRYSIYAPEKILEEKIKDFVIVIFNQNFMEIINQLNSCKELDSVECFIFPIMQTYTIVDSDLRKRTILKGEKIPKKIHYCWFGKKELSIEAKECIKSWKEKCQDYEIIRWDESNFDVNCHPYVA